jgi:hypothetical protein
MAQRGRVMRRMYGLVVRSMHGRVVRSGMAGSYVACMAGACVQGVTAERALKCLQHRPHDMRDTARCGSHTAHSATLAVPSLAEHGRALQRLTCWLARWSRAARALPALSAAKAVFTSSD